MPLLDWDSGEFSLSVKEIDEEHRKWIEIINRLHDALMNNQGNEIIEETIADLEEYTYKHFSHEEAHMRINNYPGFNDHRALHKAFKEEISQLRKDFLANELILSSQVMSRLKNWLVEHILREDKQYAEFYLKSSIDNG